MREEDAKLSLTMYGRTHSSTMPNDADMDDLIDAFIGLCVCATYQYETIVRTLRDRAQEIIDVHFPEDEENA